MVVDVAVNFVTEKQYEQIKKGEKKAFIRMEDEWQWRHLEDWKEGKELYIHCDTYDIEKGFTLKGWLIIEYIDYFKWNELKHQTELINRAGFKDKVDLKAFLDKLYGIELEENPYLFYLEYKFVSFPSNDTLSS